MSVFKLEDVRVRRRAGTRLPRARKAVVGGGGAAPLRVLLACSGTVCSVDRGPSVGLLTIGEAISSATEMMLLGTFGPAPFRPPAPFSIASAEFPVTVLLLLLIL